MFVRESRLRYKNKLVRIETVQHGVKKTLLLLGVGEVGITEAADKEEGEGKLNTDLNTVTR